MQGDYPQMAQMAQILEEESPRDPETYAIIGAAMSVHTELGNGFLEAVYQEAFSLELSDREIAHQREVDLQLNYRGRQLRTHCRVDFICFDKVIVELKALSDLTSVEESQLINYLKASRLSRGLLLNFGLPRLQYKRIVLSQH